MPRKLEQPSLPMPTGDDWKTWATSLTQVLQKTLVRIQTAADLLPILDQDGNEIVNKDGVFVYAGEEVVASPGVVKVCDDQITGVSAEKITGLGSLARKDTVGTADIDLNSCTKARASYIQGPKAVGVSWVELTMVSVAGGQDVLVIAGAAITFGSAPTGFRLRRGTTILAYIDVSVGFMQGPLVIVDNPAPGNVTYILEAMSSGAANCVSIALSATELRR